MGSRIIWSWPWVWGRKCDLGNLERESLQTPSSRQWVWHGSDHRKIAPLSKHTWSGPPYSTLDPPEVEPENLYWGSSPGGSVACSSLYYCYNRLPSYSNLNSRTRVINKEPSAASPGSHLHGFIRLAESQTPTSSPLGQQRPGWAPVCKTWSQEGCLHPALFCEHIAKQLKQKQWARDDQGEEPISLELQAPSEHAPTYLRRGTAQLSARPQPKAVLSKKEAIGRRELEKRKWESGREILPILRIHRTSTTSFIGPLPGPPVPPGKCVWVGGWVGGGRGAYWRTDHNLP